MDMTTIKHIIQIQRLDKEANGYRVLASWRHSKDAFVKKLVDAWIPELAPSRGLWNKYWADQMSWKMFVTGYLKELNSNKSQDLLKPLALLSLRQPVILLCDCLDPAHCPMTVLAKSLGACQRGGNFVMTSVKEKNHE